MSRDLIVFGEDWGGHPSSTQHLIRHLPGQRRMVWVNSIGLRRPRLSLHDMRRAAAKAAAAMGGQRRIAQAAASASTAAPSSASHFELVQPLTMPMATSAPLRRLNRALISRSVGGAATRAGLRRPVLWTSLPSAADALGALQESAIVYYCGDDFAALAGVDHAQAAALEQEVAARADLILAASPAIAARFPAAKTRLLPHGVDYDLFATPVARAHDLPDDAPVAGFYGALAPWIDIELIAQTARALPHWRFVLAGPVQCDVSLLRAEPNITLLGNRPHHTLPSYAQHWTAGIIPFRDNAQIRAANPLKLREYLAAGRPIISTEFPARQPYRAHVQLAATASDFAACLEAARAEGEQPRAAQAAMAARRAAVAGESWQARAADVAGLIDALC